MPRGSRWSLDTTTRLFPLPRAPVAVTWPGSGQYRRSGVANPQTLWRGQLATSRSQGLPSPTEQSVAPRWIGGFRRGGQGKSHGGLVRKGSCLTIQEAVDCSELFVLAPVSLGGLPEGTHKVIPVELCHVRTLCVGNRRLPYPLPGGSWSLRASFPRSLRVFTEKDCRCGSAHRSGTRDPARDILLLVRSEYLLRRSRLDLPIRQKRGILRGGVAEVGPAYTASACDRDRDRDRHRRVAMMRCSAPSHRNPHPSQWSLTIWGTS